MNTWLRPLFFLAVFSIATHIHGADSGQIRGRLLKDDVSKLPYVGCLTLMAIKKLEGEKFQVLKFGRAKTDANGRFVFKDLPVGSHLVHADPSCTGGMDSRNLLRTKIGDKVVPLEVALKDGEDIDLGEIIVNR